MNEEEITYSVVGMRIEKYIGTEMDLEHNESEVELERQIICCTKGNKKYEITLEETYGLCPGGYATASWGHMNVEEVEEFGEITHLPKKPISFEYNGEGDEFSCEAFYYSDDGGDGGHPMGRARANKEIFIEKDKKIQIEELDDYKDLLYDPLRHVVIGKGETDYPEYGAPYLFEVIWNIIRNEIPDFRANAMFGESGCFCTIGEYSDMPGEEEIAIILNSIDRKILSRYFKDNPDDITLFENMRKKYSSIQSLDDVKEEKSARQTFEESLLRDDVFEYFSSKKAKEVEAEFGRDVTKMIGYNQKNLHHVYDLWGHTLKAVESIKREGLTEEEFIKLRVAAFFHDIGKPDVASYNPKTDQQVYYGHAEHSVEVATPILENLGYSEEEIKELSFYIAHHDDFISYKSRLEPWMKNHEFIRDINPDTVSEIIIQNKYDFKAMGYDGHQIRYICYTLGHGGETPKFMTKAGPVKIDVDMSEVQEKIDSGEYDASFVPTERDYEMLLRLCKADAMSQSEVAMQNGKKVGSKKEKLENMTNIENSLSDAYKSIPEKVSEYSDEFIQKILEIASKRVSHRERSEKAKALLKEYENQMPKNNDSIGED